MSAPRSLRAALAATALASTLGAALAAGTRAPVSAAGPKPPAAAGTASFTTAQAYQGRFTFIAQCAECHGGSLQGQFGPALQGPDSNVPWQTPKAVWAYMTVHMPVGNAGGLPQRDYLNIMAFIMQSNGRRAGQAALSPAAISADPAALDQSR